MFHLVTSWFDLSVSRDFLVTAVSGICTVLEAIRKRRKHG
jgi:hypothetical protein